MRKITFALLGLSVFVASPLWAKSGGALHYAEQAIIRHQLLTPEQLACSAFEYGPKAKGEASQVMVLEKHGGQCPGDPRQPPQVRFSLYVDMISGSVQWDQPDQTILEDLPVPGVPPTTPSILTSCGVCIQR